MSAPLPVPDGAIPLWEAPPAYDPAIDQPPPHLVPHLLPGPDRPCVIICPGGAYRHLAPHEGEPIAQWLNEIGISAFVLNYRVFPYRFPAAFLDGQRAVRLVRHRAPEFGIHPSRVGMLGFSAGGHLTAHVGTQFGIEHTPASDDIDRESARPDALILCYPVINPHLLDDPDLARELIPEQIPDPGEVCLDTRVTAETPPTFLWHTAADPAVPVRNSLKFAEALQDHGVPYGLHIYPRGRHGLGLAIDEMPDVATWTYQCATWLDTLWPSDS